LDNIKQWLTTLDVKYYEGKANLNWKPLLRQIKEDPDGWLEAGGWEFLNNEASDGEDEEDEEMSEFEPSEDEDESESEDDSESESVYDSEDEEGEEELDEDDEEGLSWDELEEKAAREDADVSDSDERPKKKKR
jgi:nucleosome binding factor SPN SPT16 subunit